MSSHHPQPTQPALERAQFEIDDAIAKGREMVRQSRLLLALSECDEHVSADNDNLAA